MKPIQLTMITAVLWASAFTSSRAQSLEVLDAKAPHPVVMRIEPIGIQELGKATVVHITAALAGVRVRGDTLSLPSKELTLVTPVEVSVSAAVMDMELRTDSNRAVRVLFTEGASEAEQRLRPWGRVLSFKRIEGSWQSVAKVVPALPAHDSRD